MGGTVRVMNCARVVVAVAAVVALGGCHRPTLTAVGPRTVTNQTSFPIALYGEGFKAGQELVLDGPVSRELPIAVVDARHAYARLPADLKLPEGTVQARVLLSIKGGKGPQVPLTVVNDLGFPELIGLAVTESGRAVAISQTTGQLFVIGAGPPAVAATRTGGGASAAVHGVALADDSARSLRVAKDSTVRPRVLSVSTGDGPSAVAAFTEDGVDFVAVAHRFAKALWIWSDFKAAPRVLPAPAGVSALLVDGAAKTAYLAEQIDDSVVAISLVDGKERWRTKVAPNPQALAKDGARLAVGSAQAGVVQWIDLSTGKLEDTVQPRPGVEIDRGRTAGFSQYVIGGKAVRALVPFEGALFVASIGPNIGPNPRRMEVSLNPGVGVIEGGRFVRHLGFGEGLTEALARDGDVLFVADEGLGKVRAIDPRALKDGKLEHALLGELAIPPPVGFPRLRADSELGGKLAGPEIYSGPRALAVDAEKHRLYVLDRFTGTLAEIDIKDARAGRMRLIDQIPIVDTQAQPERRLGQVLYVGDFGRTGITCEGCHLEGHTEGVFFAKTHPLRIYRAPSLRGAKDTPPYFTPASTRSLAETADKVGNRNRFHRLPMSPAEIDALTVFTGGLTLLPNPFAAEDGAPPAQLALPWGGEGNPRHGRAVFEAHGCASCHPAPLFTTDQDGPTRGRFLDVGTPRGLPVHPEWQDLAIRDFGVPSLNGSWDVFPMLTSGAAGFSVQDGQLAISPVPPLVEVLEHEPAPHAIGALTPSERNDLYAFLLTR